MSKGLEGLERFAFVRDHLTFDRTGGWVRLSDVEALLRAPAFTADEKAFLIARLARGKSCLRWRAEEEEPAIDKLMAFLDSTQRQSSPVPTQDRLDAAEQAIAKIVAYSLRHRQEQIEGGHVGDRQTETPNGIAQRCVRAVLPHLQQPGLTQEDRERLEAIADIIEPEFFTESAAFLRNLANRTKEEG